LRCCEFAQGVRADAEVEVTLDFPTRVNDINTLVATLPPAKAKDPVTVIVPAWPAGAAHTVAARHMVAVWRALSSRLVGLGHRAVVVVAPADARFLNTPGLFACPRQLGEDGDDHWRIAVGPVVQTAGAGFKLVLARRASPIEERLRKAIRRVGGHILAIARPFRRGHQARVVGFIRDGAYRVPIRQVESPTRPNPTTALALALTEALTPLDKRADITIWTDDSLVRAALHGHYGDRQQTKYAGVKPPDIQGALEGLRRVVARRGAGCTHVRATTKGSAVALEILAASVVAEAVSAFGRAIPK
jgi:hypothetical protein